MVVYKMYICIEVAAAPKEAAVSAAEVAVAQQAAEVQKELVALAGCRSRNTSQLEKKEGQKNDEQAAAEFF